MQNLHVRDMDDLTFSVYDPDTANPTRSWDGAIDPRPKHYFYAHLNYQKTELELAVAAVDESGNRSKHLKAGKLFDEAMKYFEQKDVNIQSIHGTWVYGTNLAIFNELTGKGVPLEAAALQTWTGRQSVRHGYSRARIFYSVGTPGQFKKVEVEFSKPESGSE
jgi:hypothetical protein